MYQLLGDNMVDVEEFIEKLNGNGIHVSENLTKATKRDDAVALRIKAPLSEIGFQSRIEDEEQMNDCMEKIQAHYQEKIQNILAENFAFVLYAYTYDEVDNAVLLNFTMMDRFTARRKLPDVAKRLFDV